MKQLSLLFIFSIALFSCQEDNIYKQIAIASCECGKGLPDLETFQAKTMDEKMGLLMDIDICMQGIEIPDSIMNNQLSEKLKPYFLEECENLYHIMDAIEQEYN